MAYNSLIPQATDKPKNSQSELLANFAALKTTVELNHVDLNDVGTGKHKWVTMPVQAASPPVGAFAAGETGFYSFLDPITTKNEVYANVTHTSGVEQAPVTSSSLSFNADATPLNGWSYLPSGLLMRWGQDTGHNITTLVFSTGAGVAPAFTYVYSIQLTLQYQSAADDNVAVGLVDFTKDQFRWALSNRTATGLFGTDRTIQFLVIGRSA